MNLETRDFFPVDPMAEIEYKYLDFDKEKVFNSLDDLLKNRCRPLYVINVFCPINLLQCLCVYSDIPTSELDVILLMNKINKIKQ